MMSVLSFDPRSKIRAHNLSEIVRASSLLLEIDCLERSRNSRGSRYTWSESDVAGAARGVPEARERDVAHTALRLID
jgi:hypothetical protein